MERLNRTEYLVILIAMSIVAMSVATAWATADQPPVRSVPPGPGATSLAESLAPFPGKLTGATAPGRNELTNVTNE